MASFRNGARVRFVSYARPSDHLGRTVRHGATGTVDRKAITSGRAGWPSGFIPVVWDATALNGPDPFALAVFTRELERLNPDADPTKGPKYESGARVAVGDPVRVHPATDAFMRGLTCGTVVGLGRTTVRVDCWAGPGAPRRTVRFHPHNLIEG